MAAMTVLEISSPIILPASSYNTSLLTEAAFCDLIQRYTSTNRWPEKTANTCSSFASPTHHYYAIIFETLIEDRNWFICFSSGSKGQLADDQRIISSFTHSDDQNEGSSTLKNSDLQKAKLTQPILLTLDGTSEIREDHEPIPVRMPQRHGCANDSSVSAKPQINIGHASTSQLQPTNSFANMTKPNKELLESSSYEMMSFRNPFPDGYDPVSYSPSTSSDTSDYLRPNAFPTHRDTLARLRLPYSIRHNLDDNEPSDPDSHVTHWLRMLEPVLPKVLPLLSLPDHKSLRLACHSLDSMLKHPRTCAAYRLPSEVLQQIYQYLSPIDFDAARHTCRHWYSSSLDKTLLRYMLKKAKCWSATKADSGENRFEVFAMNFTEGQNSANLSIQHASNSQLMDRRGSLNDELLFSDRLATECRLSSDWGGIQLKSTSSKSKMPMIMSHEIDFNNILTRQQELVVTNHPGNCKAFTVSDCGRYMMVISGFNICVFRLFGYGRPPVEPICRLPCHRRVLAVNMDARPGRYAIAALHEGRIGSSWELSPEFFDTPFQLEAPEQRTNDRIRPALQHSSMFSVRAKTMYPVLPTGRPLIHTAFSEDGRFNKLAVRELAQKPRRKSLANPHDDDEEVFTSGGEFHYPANFNFSNSCVGIPIEHSQPTVFQNLGVPDDPPRSVAICPQRRCVAFGCRLGIELHWVDALTLEKLSRWFPLAAPSDHLYFLPQRQQDDSGKRLRLISSAARRNETRLSRAESAPSTYVPRGSAMEMQNQRTQSMTKLFFGSLPFPPTVANSISSPRSEVPSDDPDDGQGILRTLDCDHYQVVPLSDGTHMLFTDLDSGLVCVGSDTPLGGPSKILRKIFFIPPGTSDWLPKPNPICYATGKELDWGMRLIVAYSNGNLVLFNVPSDIFDELGNTSAALDIWNEQSGIVARSDLAMDAVMRHTIEPLTSLTSESSINSAFLLEHTEELSKPIEIHGSLLDIIKGDIAEALAVDSSGGGLKVWVFLESGMAKLYDVFDRNQKVQKMVLSETGLVFNVEDIPSRLSETPEEKGKGKAKEFETDKRMVEQQYTMHVRFSGLDGTCYDQLDDVDSVFLNQSSSVLS